MATPPTPCASKLAATSITSEKENFLRLCMLMIDLGSEVMRLEFDNIVKPADLPNSLKTNRTKLIHLPRNVFTYSMDQTLYSCAPVSYGCSNDFDISLLMVLFRNLCNLKPPPSTGNWSDMPRPSDNSLEADLVRLKLYRNELFAHTKTCSIEESKFHKYWTDISYIILQRGKHFSSSFLWVNRINHMLTIPLSASDTRWIEELKRWYLEERTVKEMLTNVVTELLTSNNGVKEILTNLETNDKDLKETLTSLEVVLDTNGTYIKEILTGLKEMLETNDRDLKDILINLEVINKNVEEMRLTKISTEPGTINTDHREMLTKIGPTKLEKEISTKLTILETNERGLKEMLKTITERLNTGKLEEVSII